MTIHKVKKPPFSLKKIIRSLETGSFRKVICGASNTSEKQVERLALVYSLCGIDVIDIAPFKGVYNAAKRGIIRASEIAKKYPDTYSKFSVPAIMKSIKVGDDKHFKKANFNLERCIQCLECAKNCQAGALSTVEGRTVYNNEKCYGCAKCVEACQQSVINMVDISHNAEGDTSYIDNFDAIEIHTGNHSVEEVKTFLEINNNIIKKAAFISVSIDSMRFNNKDLVDYANSIIKLFDSKIILQIDGISMRGGTKNSSTLQTIAAAATLIETKVNAYIQLSGGTNHLTPEIVKLAGLNISGIGYGTFAKKIILSYIEEYEEKEFVANLHKIAVVAGSLTKN